MQFFKCTIFSLLFRSLYIMIPLPAKPVFCYPHLSAYLHLSMYKSHWDFFKKNIYIYIYIGTKYRSPNEISASTHHVELLLPRLFRQTVWDGLPHSSFRVIQSARGCIFQLADWQGRCRASAEGRGPLPWLRTPGTTNVAPDLLSWTVGGVAHVKLSVKWNPVGFFWQASWAPLHCPWVTHFLTLRAVFYFYLKVNTIAPNR